MTLIPIGLFVLIAIMMLGIHKVEEGYVGIYYYNGVLQKDISEPGFHLQIPLLTKYEMV